MLKKRLLIGTYNHLPEGSPDSTFEEIYQTCYRPFLSTLNRFPDIQATLFYSGSLLKRLESRHQEYLMLLEEMTARRQIELLGGGFYAPILPLIPNSDRLGQIELLTTYLRKTFGKRPRGCWLTEYAWEPWIASTLQTCGMDFTFLSVEQFRESLHINGGTAYPVITEDQGRCIIVMPVIDCSTIMDTPQGFIQAVEATAESTFTILMSPGESIRELWLRSGLESPDLYMEQTFAWLQRSSLEIETTTPSKFLKSNRQWTKAYFPGTASRRFMRAAGSDVTTTIGSIRQAILASSTVSILYARMHHVHLLISQLRGDKSRKKTAFEDLWRSQGGDVFWEGSAGGMRLPHLRRVAYQALIDAEQTTRIKGTFKPGIIRADIDFDGNKEFLYQGTELNAYLSSKDAMLLELDVIKWRRNLCDLFYPAMDRKNSRNNCFQDHIYTQKPGGTSACQPWMDDIGNHKSTLYENNPALDTVDSVSFRKECLVSIGVAIRKLSIGKRYSFRNRQITVAYEICNQSEEVADFWFAAELNIGVLPEELNIASLDDNSINIATLYHDTGTELGQFSRLRMVGENTIRHLEVSSSKPAFLNCSKVTDSRFADDMNAVIQGFTALCHWPVQLAPEASWQTTCILSVKD
jgi:hypothetical protein